MTQKPFSSKALLGSAIIATIVLWFIFAGFTVWALWLAIPLGFWAWSRKHVRESHRIAAEAAVISFAAAIISFIILSFLLPDVFMPWAVVSFVAVVPSLVIGATLFFYLTRPVSRHARIHELEALTILVIVLAGVVFVVPQLLLANELSTHYAFDEAAGDYWHANQVLKQGIVSDSALAIVLAEYSEGYQEEVSALMRYWADSPADRCVTCVIDTYAVLKDPSLSALAFARLSIQTDRYSAMLDQDPALFSSVEECVLQSPVRPRVLSSVTRPSQSRAMAGTLFLTATQRFVRHTDYFLAGFVVSEQSGMIQDAALFRSLEIARRAAFTPSDIRIVELIAQQSVRDTTSCPVL